MNEWQPIETAPKDGTHILGYTSDPQWPYSRQIVVKWIGKYQGFSMPGVSGLKIDCWQPLPPEPSEKALYSESIQEIQK